VGQPKNVLLVSARVE